MSFQFTGQTPAEEGTPVFVFGGGEPDNAEAQAASKVLAAASMDTFFIDPPSLV